MGPRLLYSCRLQRKRVWNNDYWENHPTPLHTCIQMCPTLLRTSNACRSARTAPHSHGTPPHLTAESPSKVKHAVN